jgi:hypothetical protein
MGARKSKKPSARAAKASKPARPRKSSKQSQPQAKRRSATQRKAGRRATIAGAAGLREAPDPRVAAAIALALRDDDAFEARALELQRPAPAWTLTERPRRVQIPWRR